MPKSTRREVNPIDVVEAAYNLDGTDADWLARITELVRPLIDGGKGYMAYRYDASLPVDQVISSIQLYGIEPSQLETMKEIWTIDPKLTQAMHLAYEGLLSLVDLCKRAGIGHPTTLPPMKAFWDKHGLGDYVALQTVEPGGCGIVIAGGQPEARTIDARTRRLWARVNAHISAGRRLRAALAAQQATEEAVLTPSGKLEHAEGEGTSASAREALRGAVLRSEQARGKERKRDPQGATEAWTALVAGKWSLVDRFERGGRRYIVARRNEHDLPDPRALTPRERAVAHLAALGKPNKLIAYELGLSESVIATHLSSVMRKLGASSRVELLRLIAQLGAT
jgi:DNA-binding CsgD family transcriptional regulator